MSATPSVARVRPDVRPHVGGARARGSDDELEAGEHLDEPLREARRDIGVAGVQVQLAAAGLLPREDDLDSQPLEQRHGRAPDGGIERVREARDEESDAHGREPNRSSIVRGVHRPHATRERTCGAGRPARLASPGD